MDRDLRGGAIAVAAVVIVAVAVFVFTAGRLATDDRGPVQASPTRSPAAAATRVATPTPRPSPTAPPTPTPTPIDPAVSAAGVVTPRRSAELAMPLTGRVVAVTVEAGDEVLTGEVLVRIDQSTRQAAVDVARADVDRALAEVDRSRLLIEQLPPDASPSQQEAAQAELRLADAELRVAQTNLTEAELMLAQTELRAPFAGTVASVDVAVGEQAIANEPIVILGDLSEWFIQTVDLSELTVVRLAVGDRAEVAFEALPDLVVSGTVDQIQVRGSSQQGGVRFDVLVRPDEHHAELRWGMSASVRITPTN